MKYWSLILGGLGVLCGLFMTTHVDTHAASVTPYYTQKYQHSDMNGAKVLVDIPGITNYSDWNVYQYRIGGRETNTIKLPNNYKYWLNRLKYHTDNKWYIHKVQTTVPNNYLAHVVNQFHATAKDHNHFVNVHNLSKSEQKGLTLFTFNVINHIRKQTKTSMVRVNQVAQIIGNDISNEYNKDDFSAFNGHDVPAVTRVARKYGMMFDKTGKVQYYENTFVDSMFNNTVLNRVRFSDLKFFVYKCIAEFFFNDEDENQGHALSVSGLMYYDFNPKVVYGAVGFDYTHADYDAPALHFYTFENVFINRKSTKKWLAHSGF